MRLHLAQGHGPAFQPLDQHLQALRHRLLADIAPQTPRLQQPPVVLPHGQNALNPFECAISPFRPLQRQSGQRQGFKRLQLLAEFKPAAPVGDQRLTGLSASGQRGPVARHQRPQRLMQRVNAPQVCAGKPDHRIGEFLRPQLMPGQTGPVGFQAGIRLLKQRLGVGLQGAQGLIFFVQRGQWRQQGLHIGVKRALCVGAKAAQAACDGALGEYRFGPPVGLGLRPFALERRRVERSHLRCPARTDLLHAGIARQSVLRQRMHPRARARVMRLPRQAGGHARCQQQHIGQLIQRGVGGQAQAGDRLRHQNAERRRFFLQRANRHIKRLRSGQQSVLPRR